MPEACPCMQQPAFSSRLAMRMLQPPSAVCCKGAAVRSYSNPIRHLDSLVHVMAFQQVLRVA